MRGKSDFLTGNSGECSIRLDGFTKGSIKISHESKLLWILKYLTIFEYNFIGFLTIKEEYGPNAMNLNVMKDITFPLIRKPETDNEVNLLMQADVD